MPFKLPPPPASSDITSPEWRDWFFKISKQLTIVSNAADKLTGGTSPGFLGTGDPDGESFDGSAWWAPGLPPPVNSTGVELRQEVTGLIRGGILTATPGGTTFNISAGIGQVIDNYTNPEEPLLTPVTWTAFSGVADLHLTDEFVYIYINSAGGINQATTVPTDQDLRTGILLGVIVHSGGVISAVGIQCVTAYDNGNLAQDLFTALGAITNGCVHSGVSGALSIARTAGTVYRRGAGYASGFQTPNEVNLAQISPATVETFCRNGSNTVFSGSPAGTTFAVNVFDDGSAAPAGVPVGVVNNNQWQAIRIFLSPNGHSLLQYGEVLYNSAAAAQAAVSTEQFFEAPVLTRTAFRGFLFVRGGATDLSLPGDAVFQSAGKLGDAGTVGAPGAQGPAGPPGSGSGTGAIFSFEPLSDEGNFLSTPPGGTAQNGTPAIGVWALSFAAAHG